MTKFRLRFSKTGRAVYISHLDLMRTIQRAFLRAGYPLKYSEGFNPHAIISILLPLSVGTASKCELMDFTLAADTDMSSLPEILTQAMPEGITALEAYPVERKGKELKWLEVEGVLEYDNRSESELAVLAEKITSFFSRDKIVISKKTKRGIGEADIAPGIKELTAFGKNGAVTVRAVISAQEPTINPDLIPEALRQLCPEIAPDFAAFTRLETFDSDMKVFR